MSHQNQKLNYLIATAGLDESVLNATNHINISDGRTNLEIPSKNYTNSMIFTTNSQYLITGGSKYYERENEGELLNEFKEGEVEEEEGEGAAYSEEQEYRGGIIEVWDVITGNLVFSLEKHDDSVTKLAITSDDRILVSYSDKILNIWDFDNQKLLKQIKDINVDSCVITPDDEKLILSSANRIRILSLEDYKLSRSIKIIDEPHVISYMCIKDDLLYVSSDDSRVRTYNLESKQKNILAFELIEMNLLKTEPILCGLTVDIRTGKSNEIGLYDYDSGAFTKFPLSYQKIINMIPSPDDRYIIMSCRDNSLKFWNILTHRIERSIRRYIAIQNLAVSNIL